MTDECPSEHLMIDPKSYIDANAPWYELHLYEDNTYDSYQKGFKWSDRKPISEVGLKELKYLLDSEHFTNDRDKAVIWRKEVEMLHNA